MTKEEDFERWRKWVKTNMSPSDYHSLTEYFNANASETNWGVVEAQSQWLEQHYTDEAKPEAIEPSQSAYVHKALPAIAKADRARRNDVWEYKSYRRVQYIKKGYFGKDLEAKMQAVRVPKEIRQAPIIAPIAEKGRRIEIKEGYVVVKKTGVAMPYVERHFTPKRITWIDYTGKVITWRKRQIK